ncbi:SH3 domain protein [Teladorsagia circumcincta]|uniref:SH3 domain protein n=1 Tax=Teladorsagia circumcincta TaxID=45464 RepID=A0A2G9UHY2_TELCI|nr:SH3 domain protein [Teladorsagia circumcincta]
MASETISVSIGLKTQFANSHGMWRASDNKCSQSFRLGQDVWPERMSSQVKAEYDFEAQPGTGEMSITAGEILTVVRPNVEGGWMEGSNSRGQVGLFPESYVVPYYGAPPSVPPKVKHRQEAENHTFRINRAYSDKVFHCPKDVAVAFTPENKITCYNDGLARLMCSLMKDECVAYPKLLTHS